MEETYLSVADFAKIAGVSRQAVYSRLHTPDMTNFVKVDTDGKKQKKLINSKALALFERDASCKVDSQSVNQESAKQDNLTTFLLEQIKEKDSTIQSLLSQLEALQNQNTELTRLVDQGQKLQAMTQQQLLAPPPDQDQERETVQEKKRGFWSKLFPA